MPTLIAVVLGLMLGSFLSVLLARWPRLDGVLGGRSRCPDCMHELVWYDLVPLASWAFLRGRCHYCGARISASYPLLELTMAAVLGLSAYLSGISGVWDILDLVILFGLMALFFFDLRHQVLPDIILLSLGTVVLVRLLSQRPDLLRNAVVTGAALAAVFGLLYLFSRGRWLGLGDVKLAFVIGLLFGYPGAVGVTVAAIWSGAAVGIGLMALGRATMKTALPFGSFWTAIAVIAILWPAPLFFLSGLLTPFIP